MKINLNIPNDNIFKNIVKPLVIAGPCSAETREQVLNTARVLQKTGKVNFFRAGVWKPRTRPNSFEGIGTEALSWLKEVKQETGLKTSVEVANAKHVELALEFGIDMVWVGARTSVNPFSVQEIADALKGVKIPVLVKNPINPDLALWVGALERIHKAGITDIGAIHRGFSFHGPSPYRNKPMWELPIELMRLCPNLPIINDPSHICGNRELLLETSQRALDTNMKGIMVEVHPNPDEALSDPKQQIACEHIEAWLNQLVVRDNTSSNLTYDELIGSHREEVNQLDNELLDLLAKRFGIVEKIGQLKKEHHVSILQLDRWNEIVNHARSEAVRTGLDIDLVTKIFEAIHKSSIKQQNTILNKSQTSQEV